MNRKVWIWPRVAGSLSWQQDNERVHMREVQEVMRRVS